MTEDRPLGESAVRLQARDDADAGQACNDHEPGTHFHLVYETEYARRQRELAQQQGEA